ncbi:NB-ARC domain-containing protein [Amycolatopsis sp. GM8]|uniref:NB-ARC domain-containing protein n=1 Tax=Amycolatopsis sp. GM8 TaxID=2896530 RepID=UPI001F002B8D|nr:NB-ARC domain-containing protein [Amycolatopsis sp. GM8]
MRSVRKQVVPAAATAVSIAVAIVVNLLTSGWSWLFFVLLAVLSGLWIALEAWRAAPSRTIAEPLGAPAPPGGTGTFVARPELTGPIVRALLAGKRRKFGITTGLAGAGGFGKTTLAAEVCARPDVKAAFDRIDWVTVGQEVRGAALADAINDISERIGGQRPGLTSPEQAGIRLGELLKAKGRSLLVVDDVWTAEQLRPFLTAAGGCTLLITTRVPDLLPGDAETVKVDQMSRPQAGELLTEGVPGLPDAVGGRLLDITGRWPLALGLANGALRRAVRDGADVGETAEQLFRRLRDLGPSALDVTDSARRDRAVAATLESSLGVLGDQRGRVVELAIFPEDAEIPVELAALLWQRTAGLPPEKGELLCQELVDLSLLTWSGGRLRVRLHDVIRSYLWHECGPEHLGRLHNALLDAVAATLPEPAGWWTLPRSAEYLWRRLAYHLEGAGRAAELAVLVTAPHWVIGKLRRFGPVAVAEDLAFARTDAAKELSRFIDQQGHLLIPGEPEHAVVNALALRLPQTGALEELRRVAEAEVAGRPRLVPRRAMPDLPDPALNRVLSGHDGWVDRCAFAPDGSFLVSVARDGIRVWHPETGQLVRLIETGVYTTDFALSPDGQFLVCEGPDNQIQLWDTGKWQFRALLPHENYVEGYCFSADGHTLVGLGKTIVVWDVEAAKVLRSFKATEFAKTSEEFGDDNSLVGGKAIGFFADRWKTWDFLPEARTGLDPATSSLFGVAVDRNGKWAARLESAGLSVYDLTEPTRPPRMLHQPTDLSTAVFSPDGSILATGGRDGVIILWNVPGWRPRAQIGAHLSEINALSFSPDGSVLASASDDGTVRLWNPVRADEYNVRHLAVNDTANACVAAQDGSWLAVDNGDSITIHDPASGIREKLDYTGRFYELAPVGSSYLAVEQYSEILICESANWQASRTLRHPHDSMLGDLSTGGTFVCATDRENRILVWDLDTWAPPLFLEAGESGVKVREKPARPRKSLYRWLARRVPLRPTGWRDRLVARLLRPVVRRAARRSADVTMVVAPDGAWLMVIVDETAHVVAPKTGDPIATLRLGTNQVKVLPDGSRFAVGIGDTIEYWNTGSWTRETEFEAPEIVSATDGAWSPDGSLLATVSDDDRTLRIHDSGDGTCLTELRFDGELTECRWLTDERLVAVGGRGVYWFSYLPAEHATES